MDPIHDNTSEHRDDLRGGFPGQLQRFGVADFGSLYLYGNANSSVPLCNLGDTGMSYYPVEGEPTKNMNDLITKAEDGKMPDRIWEASILKDVPASMRPGDDVTKPYKVRSS